jgi:murein DD-endopeptidase MepM/ murein hydrolase activator NlpD
MVLIRTWFKNMPKINFKKFQFSPVIDLPANYEVYDFTQGYDPSRSMKSEFGIGRFNEVRKNMYTTELFKGERNIHMGIDIAAPIHHPIKSFFAGKLFMKAYNGAAGDYGYTLIVEHEFDGTRLWALYGHLSKTSFEHKKIGDPIARGEVIAWIGDKSENGGWNPHLHLQLSLEKPEVCDMPGAVSSADRDKALAQYIDPREILGPLY